MPDVSYAIVPKSDQLNAQDLLVGPKTITITQVDDDQSRREQPVWIFYEGHAGRPWKPCKTMIRLLTFLWGPNTDDWIGRAVRLYCDPDVKWGGEPVGGIRVSHASHISGTTRVPLSESKTLRKTRIVEPLETPPPGPAPEPDELPHELLAAGHSAARQGSQAFAAWWNTPEAKAHRDALRPHLEHFKEIAAETDKGATG